MNKIIYVMYLLIMGCNDQSALSVSDPLPYTVYRTGNERDIVAVPKGGICLMGGNKEVDNAMRWFLNQANQGDILVLRASGSDGYNDFMFSQLGVTINSVTSIVMDSRDGSFHPYLRDQIEKAEGIWFAGGNQWKYVDFWKDTPIDSLIQDAVQNRNVVIGGTSAGMAILGEYVFSAEKGTFTSSEALENPYHDQVTIDTFRFFSLPILEGVITDSHYSQRDRQGRHVALLARVAKDKSILPKGVGLDENTAITIDNNGAANIIGEHNAYFIQATGYPELCVPDQPLTWDHNGNAMAVYVITKTGTFDFADWQSGTGGTWQHWFVMDGVWKFKSF